MAQYQVNPGELRTRITLQEPTVSKDSGAAQKATFADVDINPHVWARWINAHGQENVQSAMKSTQRATVTIRYRSDVKTTWQILKDGLAWQIVSLDSVQDRKRWIEMVVERTTGTV